jgi:hypothetical protein
MLFRRLKVVYPPPPPTHLPTSVGGLVLAILHCKEISTYVSVSHLYIPRTGPHISLQQNRQTDPGNI